MRLSLSPKCVTLFHSSSQVFCILFLFDLLHSLFLSDFLHALFLFDFLHALFLFDFLHALFLFNLLHDLLLFDHNGSVLRVTEVTRWWSTRTTPARTWSQPTPSIPTISPAKSLKDN